MPRRGVAVSVLTSCLRGERYLTAFLACVARQTIVDRIEVILVHNAPTAAELAIVRAFALEHPSLVRHLIVEQVEPLPVSWNRGIRSAVADYLTIWNIDDLRTDDSLERQLGVLEGDPAAVATYGDFIVVPTYGAKLGRLISPSQYDPEAFTLAYHGGCFPMWRRSVMRTAGLFDEQLPVVADFDFFVRLAFNGPMRKTDGLLGYYLDAGQGLSTRVGTPLYYERTLVERRYGMYANIDYRFYLGSRSFRRDDVLFAGDRHPIESLVPDYQAVLKRRRKKLVPGYLNFLALMLRAAAGRLRRAAGAALTASGSGRER